MKKLVLVSVSVILVAGLIYFSGTENVISQLAKANPIFILAGFGLWLTTLFIRTQRWQILLRNVDIRIPFTSAMSVFVGSMFISNLTPAKIGDPIRCYILKKIHNQSFGKSLSSLIIERMSDLLSIIIIYIIGIQFIVFSNISFYINIAVAIYLLLIIILISVLSSENRTKNFVNLFSFFFSLNSKLNKIRYLILKTSKNVHDSFIQFKNKKVLIYSLLISIVVWIVEGTILYLSFLSIGVNVPIVIPIIILPIATLTGILSFLPGGLGSSEIIMVLLFVSIVGTGLAEATAAVLITRFITYWMSNLLSGIVFTSKYNSSIPFI